MNENKLIEGESNIFGISSTFLKNFTRMFLNKFKMFSNNLSNKRVISTNNENFKLFFGVVSYFIFLPIKRSYL